MRLSWKLLQRPAQALPSMALPEAKAIPKPLAVNSIPTYDAVVKTRKDKINPGLLTYYKKPLYITQGSMQWLWDDKGQRYLDLFGGIVTVSVGHCHPKVKRSIYSHGKKNILVLFFALLLKVKYLRLRTSYIF